MSTPLMPKATAVWLLENTALTFEQISKFCGMYILEVEALANDENNTITGLDPIATRQLTAEEIERCTQDPYAFLQLSVLHVDRFAKKTGAKYTPLSRRQDKPNAISWILKNHPHMSESQIVRLIGTTKSTIQAIRDKTHWNIQNIKPQSPILLGLCSQEELDAVVSKLPQRSIVDEYEEQAQRGLLSPFGRSKWVSQE